MDDPSSRPNFFERLLGKITGEAPESQEEIKDTLRQAFANEVVDADTLQRLENVLEFSRLNVRDVMITRSQMDVVRESDTLERITAFAIDTAHSRFPVIGDDKDEILGILHAKDLLKFFKNPEQFHLKPLLRKPTFIPESKSLNALLKDFRDKHIHMAIVVDEYGGVSGLVTFEDVIEAIIGDIEDEFDEDDSADNIFEVSPGRYRIKAITEIDDLNAVLGTHFNDEEADTIGGLIVHAFERLPERGEKIDLDGWRFTVARADARRLHTLMMTRNGTE